MTRPKIKIQPTLPDRLIEVIGAIGFLCLVVYPILHYAELPDSIPTHFSADGKPDSYNDKWMIWLLPGIGAITYIGLTVLNKYPHIFNYPSEITEENAERQYRMATRMIRILNTSITCFFAYITYSTISIAMGIQNDLGSYFTLFFIGGTVGITVVYAIMAMRAK